ncbi:MAG: tRNA pseudouridine(54/55) synthase Pus10 [Candidatus Heimdallarchaeota archaeon]|nr:tRNA pseudouridine(54/55) synthase Pus10 [Candidatus Heimdallarchaeota archaeon]MDH5645150.1 tRNA pseudouridine(54/55) synthase Pus10 [Candidatus Heimdallarchaeota archaeon]
MDINSNLQDFITDCKPCQRCIGRCLATTGSFELNQSLNKFQEIAHFISTNLPEEEKCEICEGLVHESLGIVDKLIENISKYDFEDFLVGSNLPKELIDKERIFHKYNLKVRTLKQEISREIGLRISEKLTKPVNFEYPDITVLISKRKNVRFELQIKSIYLLGLYNKFERGIPQTKWPCTYCKGKKCAKCNNTGQQYPESVETLISSHFIELAKTNSFSFHGAGREDIDALMLGRGRPFVLEIKNPKARNLDLDSIVEKINESSKIKVSSLQYTEKSIVKEIKEQSPDSYKIYRAKAELQHPLSEESLNNLKNIENKEVPLKQRTPIRVSHRRGDLIREKKVFSVKVEEVTDEVIVLQINAQGGTYIKEFISGDEGRTIPNISEIINQQIYCKELDVIYVQSTIFHE